MYSRDYIPWLNYVNLCYSNPVYAWILDQEESNCLPRMAGDQAEQPQVKHDKRIPAKGWGWPICREPQALVYHDL